MDERKRSTDTSRIFAIALAFLAKTLTAYGTYATAVAWTSMGVDSADRTLKPVDRQEGFKLLGGWVVHEFLKHPLKVGE